MRWEGQNTIAKFLMQYPKRINTSARVPLNFIRKRNNFRRKNKLVVLYKCYPLSLTIDVEKIQI